MISIPVTIGLEFTIALDVAGLVYFSKFVVLFSRLISRAFRWVEEEWIRLESMCWR